MFTGEWNVGSEPFAVELFQCFSADSGSLRWIHAIPGAKSRMGDLQIGGMDDVADKITVDPGNFCQWPGNGILDK